MPYLICIRQSDQKSSTGDTDQIRDRHRDASHTGPVCADETTGDQGKKLYRATRDLHVLRAERVKPEALDDLAREARQRRIRYLSADSHHE